VSNFPEPAERSGNTKLSLDAVLFGDEVNSAYKIVEVCL
jgi:hypothetical protein